MIPPPRPRRIYVDHTHLRGHVTGIERVALDLFAPDALRPHAVEAVRSPGLLAMIAAQHIGLPMRGLVDPAALVVFPGFPPGPLALALGPRCLTYIHDTFLLDRARDLSWKSRLYMAPSFALAMRFGRSFFVNSATTGAALRRHCASEALVALLRPRIRDVFGLAGSAGPAAFAPERPLRVLAIGTIEPRKDYAAAIAIVAALNAGGTPTELHLVGRVGWGSHEFLRTPPPFLTLHGYVDDASVGAIVGSCHLLLSTSKAEGLGLPLLEVQHGGLPVVAPRGSVFSEVLGESALLVAPEDADAAAAAIRVWIERGGLAAAAARGNVARWNAAAEADLVRFRTFLSIGRAAYDASDGVIPAIAGAS